MRMIDADRIFKLLKEQEEKETGVFTKGINKGINIAKCIIKDDVQSPTTYSVEKVVEQLEEMFKHHNATKTVKRLVIEIVKGGGVNED